MVEEAMVGRLQDPQGSACVVCKKAAQPNGKILTPFRRSQVSLKRRHVRRCGRQFAGFGIVAGTDLGNPWLVGQHGELGFVHMLGVLYGEARWSILDSVGAVMRKLSLDSQRDLCQRLRRETFDREAI